MTVSRLPDPIMNQPDIPELVRNLRERLGMTQEQFAQEVGVSYTTVNQWENGRRAPQPFLLRRLLEIKAKLDGSESSEQRGDA